MQADDVFQEKFNKGASRAFDDRMSVTARGLVLGGALLAKMGVMAAFASMARKSGF
jgi:hypothetical protein